MKQEHLQAYARLICFGIEPLAGRKIFVRLEEPGLPLARAVAEECYRQGASLVHFDFSDNALIQSRLLHGSEDAVEALPDWTTEMVASLAGGDWTIVNLRGSDSDSLLSTVDPQRSARYGRSMIASRAPVSARSIKFEIPWIISLVPTLEKARAVFPDKDGDEALELYTSAVIRVLQLDADPVAFWKESFAALAARRDRFNALKLREIHMVDEHTGTDLYLPLLKQGRWATAEEILPAGNPVRVNIPSCEIYCSPDYRGVRGKAVATKPFISTRVVGDTVEGAWMEFSEGRVTSHGATRGQETFTQVLDFDKQARSLGELALVDATSPIARENMLFHSILFDENAASHIAVGAGFPSLVEGMSACTPEEQLSAGLNASMQHQDIMIGSPSMTVTGTTSNGEKLVLMENGSFTNLD